MTTDTKTTAIPCDEYGRISGKTLADVFSRFNNATGNPQEVLDFAKAVANDHRTLQQAMTGTMLSAIVAMANNADGGWTDARNESSAEVCRKLRDLLEAEGVFIRDGVVRFPLI